MKVLLFHLSPCRLNDVARSLEHLDFDLDSRQIFLSLLFVSFPLKNVKCHLSRNWFRDQRDGKS